ncbi:MAG: 2-hydroxyacyl-CoA dehydratase [Planctomycetota bacterium]|nr:2-hydroxyacyl-CoA dehydratase [Planctomycetota bacterium]
MSISQAGIGGYEDLAADAVGITTTVPVEVIFAAGRRPVDLNNLFISSPDAAALVAAAEAAGFPKNSCAWVKGIYAARARFGIAEVVGVVEGDCSDTGALLDVWRSEGVKVHEFGFPHSRAPAELRRRIQGLAEQFGVTLAAAEEEKRRLDEIRGLARQVDMLAAAGAEVSSQELFAALLWCTDFLAAPERCRQRLAALLADIQRRPPAAPRLRLACAGVPPIFGDLWETLESLGARIVFHEIPRQFALVASLGRDLVSSYLAYTYPYAWEARLADLRAAVQARKAAAIIHYAQTFCHRQIHDRLLRASAGVPVLTLEADQPAKVDARTRTRLEAFLEQWHERH